MDIDEPVVVYSVKNATQAKLIKNFLESEGIPCSVGGEGQIGLAGLMDIQILVRAVDSDKAKRLIASHERSQLEGDEEESV
jgi:hypothetical protein